MMMVNPRLRADEAQCREVLHKCDIAVTKLETENNLQRQIIADQDKRHELMEKQLNAAGIWKPIAIGGVSVSLVLILGLTAGFIQGR